MTAEPVEYDYAHSSWAQEKRQAKALEVAKVLWAQRVRPEHAVLLGEHERKQVEKQAGVRTSHRDLLWDLALTAYRAKWQWEVDHAPKPADDVVWLCLLPCLCKLAVRFTPGGARCRTHDRWINPVPDPALTLDGLRARSSMTVLSVPTHTVKDDQDIASGKRRAPTHAYNAAREALSSRR